MVLLKIVRKNIFRLFAPEVLGIWLVFCGFSSPIFAQDQKKFDFDFQAVPLKKILDDLTLITGFEFAYSDTEINSSQLITITAKQENAPNFIRLLATNSRFEAFFSGKKVILKAIKEKEVYHISGVVSDAEGLLPLPGANIVLRDGSQGTTSDSNGSFELDVIPPGNKIRVSFIGYSTSEIVVESDTILHVKLQEEIRKIEETVVVAFGMEQPDLLTGAVSYMKMDLINQQYPASINASLQSEIAGLLIQSNGGTPASSFNVTIRGISSINAGNKPLFVVDGMPVIAGDYSQLDFSGQSIDAISDLSVNDIESVSVLKDAAASSLFGSNSSNGVILINTKRGSQNQNQVDIYTQYGVQQTTGMLNLLNATQWMNLVNEESIAAGKLPVYSDGEILNNTIDTDWQKEVFQLAPTFDLGLSVRGGNDQSKYYISGNYFDQEGIIIGSDFRRYNLRVNYDHRFSEKLSIEAGNGFAYSINNRVEGDQTLNGPLPNAISQPSVFPVLNSDGSYNNDGPYANPVSIAKLEKNLAYTYRNTFHFKINYQLHKNLMLRSLSGIDFYDLGEQTFAPKTTRQGNKYNGLGIEATSNSLRFYNSTYVDYDFRSGLNRFSVTAGFSFEGNQQHDVFLRAQNFPGTSFEFLQDAATPIATQSFETNSTANSIYARLKYNFDDRYIVTFNQRYDGSSKFGSNNRYGYFPSVSGLWYTSKEDFFESNAFTKLIFSGSYGITGNDQIGNFMSLGLYSAGSNYAGEGGISPTQLANPDLKWETTGQLNVGAQIELYNRVNIRTDYYLKNTKDLLLQKPMPNSTGYPYIMDNIGKLQNQGIEMLISYSILQHDFKWDASLNLTANRNKVIELYEGQPIRGIGRAESSIAEGEPVSYFYGLNSLGVNPADGNLIYEDLNKDGKITDIDRKKIGSPHPDLYGGFGNIFYYKGFGLNLMFSFSYGNEIFNSTRIYTETISQSNQTTEVLHRWQKPGDQSDIPKASVNNRRISSRFVEDGSYLRLKNIRFSYDLPSTAISNAGLKNLQLFLGAKNLLTFTRYSGIDPEVNYDGVNSMVIGTDFFTCPQPKTILIGLCARF